MDAYGYMRMPEDAYGCFVHCGTYRMYTYIHTYIHSYIHTFIHTYIHTYVHTYIHTYIHTLHTYIHTCIHTYIHTYDSSMRPQTVLFFSKASIICSRQVIVHVRRALGQMCFDLVTVLSSNFPNITVSLK